MKLHYKGTYDLNPDSLPHGEHRPGAVAFKEMQDSKQLSLLANGLSIVLLVLFAIPVFFRSRPYLVGGQTVLGLALPILTLFPHELLHALCFRQDVYLYTNFRQGMLFVIGPEDMSKGRFIFMSLLPNIVFGFVPYLIGMLFPQLVFFSIFGALCISMGAGDYYNVYNALTQVPNGALVYLYKFNSFWYLPAGEKKVSA